MFLSGVFILFTLTAVAGIVQGLYGMDTGTGKSRRRT
jgi:hypothetical protein